MFKILSINPGSTTTKIGIFHDDVLMIKQTIVHDPKQFEHMQNSMEQISIRTNDILHFLADIGEMITGFDAFAARGGILPPMQSGTYRVNDEMLDFLKNKSTMDHPSNLAAVIADDYASKSGTVAYICDPISTDEFDDLARISGFADIERRSLVHALNMKAVARIIAKEIDKPYEECNLS